MIKNYIAQDIIQYMFEPEKGGCGFNILAVIDNQKAILIDTAYEQHSSRVRKDLEDINITIEKVIVSHFHPDHIAGLLELPKVSIYGSSKFKTALELYMEKEYHDRMTPTTLVEESLTIRFGTHELKLITLPGHSECEMITIIDNKYVQVGDEIMTTNDGKAILPSIDHAHVKRHIDSLTKLIEYGDYTIIPSHGKLIEGKETIKNEINNRLYYLKAIANPKPITYEEAVKDCTIEFECSHWHDNIYR